MVMMMLMILDDDVIVNQLSLSFSFQSLSSITQFNFAILRHANLLLDVSKCLQAIFLPFCLLSVTQSI